MQPDSKELTIEKTHLVQAERDIAEGEERVRNQTALTLHLQGRGEDGLRAERLLVLLEETLIQWKMHRELIVSRIAYLEQKGTA